MSKEDLLKKVEGGQIKIITSSQILWTIIVFIITTAFAFGVTYASYNSRISNLETDVAALQRVNYEKQKILDELLLIAQENRNTIEEIGKKLGVTVKPLNIIRTK
jgi:hypothetical protein